MTVRNQKSRSEREIIHHLSRPLLLLFKSGKIKMSPFLNKPSFPKRDMRYDYNIPLAGSLAKGGAMRLALTTTSLFGRG